MESLHLDEGLGVLGGEPVHTVHDLFLVWLAFVDGVERVWGVVSYNGVAEGAWSDSTDDFL